MLPHPSFAFAIHSRSLIMKIVLTGGGSGGPTTPLIAVYEELKKRALDAPGSAPVNGPKAAQIEVVFLGTVNGAERSLVEHTGIPFIGIPSGKLRRYFSLQNFIDPFKVLWGFFVGAYHLIKIKPQVVVSAGSFVSVPVALAAWLLRIPNIVLQMDVKPGLANQLMSPFATKLLLYFQETAQRFRHQGTRIIGPVVRPSVREGKPEIANELFKLKDHRPVLLITGGGQGALGLNNAVAEVIEDLLGHFQVVHLYGKQLQPINITHEDYHPLPFVDQGMGDLLARAELVITRAGLGIIGELAFWQRDTVLVPLPNTHQELNAQVIASHDAAWYLPQFTFQKEGAAWWLDFWKHYQPGVKGANLSRLLPAGGVEIFADEIIALGLQNTK